MATVLADSPLAPPDEQGTPPAVSAGAPPLPPDGSPATPPSAPAPAAHACSRCGSPMAAGQDWCRQCGAGAPGSIGAPGWRSAATILTVTAVLALGAAAAAYAALSKGTPATHMITTTVAQAATPAPTSTPTPTTPSATTTPLPQSTIKPPKIPLTAATAPKTTNQSSTTQSKTTGSSTTNTTTTPSNTGGAGSEAQSNAIVLDTDAASTYNPYKHPESEFGDPSLTIDGDTSTGWSAQVEAAAAPNMAEGVLLDLKARQKVSKLELITSTPGMTVQVFGAKTQTAPASIVDPAWIPLSNSRVIKKRHARIALRDSSKAFTFLTLWISKAPASSTPALPGHVSVNEIELFPEEE